MSRPCLGCLDWIPPKHRAVPVAPGIAFTSLWGNCRRTGKPKHEDEDCDQPEPRGAKPKVVCLCGSTRFWDEFIEANRLETMEGHIVLAPGAFAHSGHPIGYEEKARLDILHLRKIDMADEVLVVNPGGYIGESTSREIAYAMRTGKPVRYTAANESPPKKEKT